MKKFLFMMLAIPMVFAACSKDEAEPQPQPQPTPDPTPSPALTLTSEAEMSFEANGGNGVITYTLTNPTEGVELTATCEADWVSNLTAGDNVVFVVAANEGDARETTITVAYDTLSFDVVVKQAAKAEEPENKAPQFTLTSEEVMEFGQNEAMGTITFELKNPIQGVNVTAKANVSWISQVTPQAEKIIFAVAANTGDAREGKITAKYGELSFEVTIKQVEYVAPAPIINLDTTAIEVSAEGGAQSVAYSVDNAVEGVEFTATCEAEWITNLTVADGNITFDVAASEESGMRSTTIVTAYGEVTKEINVSQLPANANPDMEYKSYIIVSLKAETTAADAWKIILQEHDDLLGDIYTRISVKLPADKAMYITDGEYSVANGGITLNTSTNNSYSTYRYNGNAQDISDCTIEVTNDLENQTSIIKGSFTVGNTIFSFNYRGTVNGFVYEKIGDEGITAWDEFYIYSQWDTTKYIVAKSSGISMDFFLNKLGGKKSDPLAVGTYPVGEWEYTTTRDYCDMSSSKVNGTLFVSGTIVVEEDAAGYKFTFDVTDANGTNWKGTYIGPITTK